MCEGWKKLALKLCRLRPMTTPEAHPTAEASTQTPVLPVEIASERLRLVPSDKVYCVWRLRGAEVPLRGVHCGEGLSAWWGICGLIPGHVYRSGADRLRRVRAEQDDDIISLASALFLSECEEGEKVHFFWWASVPGPPPRVPRRLRSVQPSSSGGEPESSGEPKFEEPEDEPEGRT